MEVEDKEPGMQENDFADGRPAEENEYEIDSDDTEDLEAAMQEALEAVEKADRSDKPKALETKQIELANGSSMAEEVGVEDLQAEIADLRDRSARTLADFDNYRKRVERERAEERRFAGIEALRDFLAVVDNLERAISSEGSADDLKVGVELIHRQMKDLLTSFGVKRVKALGEEFDPRFHEAVSRLEDPEVAVPTVSEEMQAGYAMHDRLLRPAIVRVAIPSGEEDDEGLHDDDSEVEGN